jgi:hypothetical protein
MKLGEEHIKILVAFQLFDVEYILVGGHAAIYYGVERTTSDIDILVRPGLKNGIKILQAFEHLKLDTEDINPNDFTNQLVLSFGTSPEEVDIMNYIIGPDIDDAFRNAIQVNLEGLDIQIIDIRDLLKNKLSLHRTDLKGLTDQQDILVLKKILNLL